MIVYVFDWSVEQVQTERNNARECFGLQHELQTMCQKEEAATASRGPIATSIAQVLTLRTTSYTSARAPPVYGAAT